MMLCARSFVQICPITNATESVGRRSNIFQETGRSFQSPEPFNSVSNTILTSENYSATRYLSETLSHFKLGIALKGSAFHILHRLDSFYIRTTTEGDCRTSTRRGMGRLIFATLVTFSFGIVVSAGLRSRP
jgi:hypothetical protein